MASSESERIAAALRAAELRLAKLLTSNDIEPAVVRELRLLAESLQKLQEGAIAADSGGVVEQITVADPL